MNAVEAWREMLRKDQELLALRDDLDAGPRLVDAERGSREAHDAFTAEVRRANGGSILPEQDAAA